MNVKILFMDELLEKQHIGVFNDGRTIATPKEIESEINRRLEIARSNPNLRHHYQSLMKRNAGIITKYLTE